MGLFSSSAPEGQATSLLEVTITIGGNSKTFTSMPEVRQLLGPAATAAGTVDIIESGPRRTVGRLRAKTAKVSGGYSIEVAPRIAGLYCLNMHSDGLIFFYDSKGQIIASLNPIKH